jgi:hypothetical protein
MKTIEEKAREQAYDPAYGYRLPVYKSFIAGVEFAQRWISVEEELPPQFHDNGSSEAVLTLDRLGNYRVGEYQHLCGSDWSFGGVIPLWLLNRVTHWRYIELK